MCDIHAGNTVILSETTDFANNIQVKQEEPSGDPVKEMHERGRSCAFACAWD